MQNLIPLFEDTPPKGVCHLVFLRYGVPVCAKCTPKALSDGRPLCYVIGPPSITGIAGLPEYCYFVKGSWYWPDFVRRYENIRMIGVIRCPKETFTP